MIATSPSAASPPRDSAHARAVTSVTQGLLTYCRDAGWAGWDPYDGLNSRFFRAIPFFQNKLCRLAFIQFMKRCPVNLRPLFGVPPRQNPKGVALFASCLARLAPHGLATMIEARALADRVLELRVPGQSYDCWGYHFDWQTRSVLVPPNVPNIVCTTFAAQALLDLFEATGDQRFFDAADSAGRFVVEELASNLPDDAFCIRYQMLEDSTVHNASLLGAALLARLYGHTGEPRLEPIIAKAARYSLDRQRPDGSWPYAETPRSAWIDSFHTGYNLLAFREIGRHLAVPGLNDAVRRGYRYYLDHFFRADGAVRYFHDRPGPVDAHALGHALLTLSEFADDVPESLDLARRVFDWSCRRMLAPDGCFFYQDKGWYINRISYIRWSQAWMLVGLVGLLNRLNPPQSLHLMVGRSSC
jgi:rhamnogalacturonyl hydrolase YesR